MQVDPPEHDSSFKNCPLCGKEIKKTAYRCPFCHESLAEFDQRQWEDPSLHATENESEKSTVTDLNDETVAPLRAALLIAAVIAIAIVVSFRLFSTRESGPDKNAPLPWTESGESPDSTPAKSKEMRKPPKLDYPEPAPLARAPSAAAGHSPASAFKQPPAGAPDTAARLAATQPAVLTGHAGIDLDELVPGRTTKASIKSQLGEPDLQYARVLDYNATHGLELIMSESGDVLGEIRINSDRFTGRLSSGLSLASSKQDVFAVYGPPAEEIFAEDLHSDARYFKSGCLYGNRDFGRISYEAGVTFWFFDDRIIQIAVATKH